MKIKGFVALMIIGLSIMAGCGKANKSGAEYDIDNILMNQKIVFIMSVSSYAEPYAEGYFIDATGKKHIYGLYDQRPFESIEKEYAYLMEHYDEFETIDFFDDTTLKKCTEYLYYVDADSEIIEEGMVIMDFPEKQLYGIKLIDGHEEFVWLGSETGITKKLDDASVDLIFEEFGEKWYLLK